MKATVFFCAISAVRLALEHYDCAYVKHERNIKKQIASFCHDCILHIHMYYKSPHSIGYSLKACLFASLSNHPISKSIEKLFLSTVCKAPNYDDDELFLWYG